MGYDAKVFNVMIASPGDVVDEREIVQQCIHTWNANHSEYRKIVLLPLRWESHSSPEMGDHPQTIINRQVLEKADLLIGLFWKRIGTKTKGFISGTVEEIETHIDSGKPTMVYFSDVNAPPSETNTEQFSEVQKYRIELTTRGLYNGYTTTEQFKEKLTNHLTQKLNNHPLFLGTSREDLPKPPPVKDVQKIYILAENVGSDLSSFREIVGEKFFRITAKYGLKRWGDDANKLEREIASQYEKERHQWSDGFTKEYAKRFNQPLEKLRKLITSEVEQTPAFTGYADRLKKFPRSLEDMRKTIECLTEVSELARSYVGT